MLYLTSFKAWKQVARKSSNALVTIYKIKSLTDVTAYIGYTTDPESTRKIIENDGARRFAFDVIRTQVPWRETAAYIASEIKKHRNWAVFNREDPERARYSNQLRIEIFCQHFDIHYNEVLAHPEKFENLMERFDNLTENIEKEKRRVNTGLFDPNTIVDPVVRAFAKRYESIKQEADAIDFLDMLIYSAYLLENWAELRQYYCERYPYVLVDEFQDISPVDFRLISQLSENIFAVGDDDQAIYGFRGGDSLIMQEKFGKRENVTHYEITRNYRSTSTIVRHAKTLIEHNLGRIPKNLRANNSTEIPVEFLTTPQKTTKVNETLLDELSSLLTTDTNKVGVLARNWKGEINDINEILDFSELQERGFEIGQEELGDRDQNRIKTVLRHGTKKIEILNIHNAKGREWEKVIFLVNTMYNSLPDNRNDLAEERRLFYVAVTRAKQELVILDGGNCEFVPEFQSAPVTKEELAHAFKKELGVREPKLKIELEKVFKESLAEFQYKLKKNLAKTSNAARKQNDAELSRLHSNIAETKDAATQLETKLLTDLRVANTHLLEGLIPTLDEFEVLVKNLPETDQSNNNADYTVLVENVRLAQEQLCASLESHGLKSIAVSADEIFNPTYHEEISSAIYSDEVPAGQIARSEQRGYLLYNQVIRKAQVVISKGENIRIPEQLDRLTEIYIDRLISRFQTNFQLTKIDKPFIIRKMVQYLSTLDNTSIEKLRSFATKGVETIGKGRFADYCVGPEKTHLCTDIVFRNFWSRMWEVVEKSKKTPESQIKQAQPSIDKSAFVYATQKSTLDEPIEETDDSTPNTFTDGEIVKGIVVDVTRDEVMINIGFKSESYIPASEFDTGENDLPAVQVGDEIDVYIVRREDAEGQIVLSKKIADQTLVWDKLAAAYETGTPIKGRIAERLKGGLRVKIGSLRGFLPASQVELRPIQNLEQYVGQTLDMVVISLNKRQHNIVLSRRAWLDKQRTKFLNTLEVGQQVTGIVKNIRDFGAFVALGGVDGLLHKSEIAWGHVNHPSEIVAVGENIEVKVIEFDRENEKISLSLKQLTGDPWESIKEKYPAGSAIRGIVTNVVNYGAFVQLEEGIDGLIHISKMPTDSRDVLPADIVNKGDEVEAVVIKISKNSRRISLSMIANLPRSVEDPHSASTSDTPDPTEKIKGEIPDDLPESITITPTEDPEDTSPVPEESSFKGETNGGTLCTPINPTNAQDIKETVGSSPSMSKELTEILNSQTQNLKPEPIKTEISPEPRETVSDNPQLTPQESNEILKRPIQNLKPALPKENANPSSNTANNTSDQLIEPIYSETSEQTSNSPSSIETSHEEKLPKDESENRQSKLKHHLRKFGCFVLRKLNRK